MKLVDERISEFLDLRFNLFSDYARYILDQRLHEYVDLLIDFSFEVNVPILKYFSSFSREQLHELSVTSSSELLEAIAGNTVAAYIDQSKRNWLADQLRIVNKENVIAEDITLISLVRRKAFRALLPDYTSDLNVYVRIMDEVDKFTVISDSVFLNTLIRIQQEQVSRSRNELEKREQQLLEAQAIGNIGSFEWDLPGNKAYYSPQVFSIFEVEPQKVFELDLFRQWVHELDRNKVTDAIRDSLRSGNFSCEYRIHTGSGDKYILSKGRVIYDDTVPVRMVGTLMDITEKQQIIKRLEESESQNKQAEAITHMGNWAWYPATNEVQWSDELFRIYGLEPGGEKITPDTFNGFLAAEDKERFSGNWIRNANGEKLPEETFRILRRDGTMRTLKSKGEIIFDAAGNISKVIGTIQDVTAEHQLTEKLREREQYLNQLNRSLARKNEELISKNRELESFNFITSHDLQEPLRKIQVFTDRLITENPDNFSGATLNAVARIRAAAQRMQKLIEDFLEFSQTLSPTRPFEMVDLNEILEESISELQTRLQDKRGKVAYAKLPSVWAIRYQMKQLFVNLISNSLKYSQPGEPPLVHVTASADKDETSAPVVTISFKDNGIGFEQKYAGKVFELFQRLHNKNEYSGTGIGLALCKKICENHNGTITVSSEPLNGTTFTITLPAAGN